MHYDTVAGIIEDLRRAMVIAWDRTPLVPRRCAVPERLVALGDGRGHRVRRRSSFGYHSEAEVFATALRAVDGQRRGMHRDDRAGGMIANLLTAAGELDAGRAAFEVTRELEPTPDRETSDERELPSYASISTISWTMLQGAWTDSPAFEASVFDQDRYFHITWLICLLAGHVASVFDSIQCFIMRSPTSCRVYKHQMRN